MARIRSIQIKGFRSCGEYVALDFPDGRPVVLVGENSAGKSNIIRALDLMLGERWPGNWAPEDHDFFGRDPENALINITVDVEGFKDRNGLTVEKLQLSSLNGSTELNMVYANGSTRWPSGDLRTQLSCVVIGADRRLSYELSYASQWTLLSKLMKKFHKALMADPDRVQALQTHFAHLHSIFAGVPEFASFSTQLSSEVAQLSTNLQYGLEVDFSAYDPSNYFRALRVLPTSGADRRTFDELGTGQEQVLALGFAYAYAATFGKTGEGLLLVIEEPESHLHPLAQEWLATQVHRFIEAGVQIVLTTHSPHFVDIRHLDGLVVVRKDETGCTYTEQKTAAQLARHCEQNGAPAISPAAVLDYYAAHATSDVRGGFFARAVLLVEGPTEELALPVLLRKAGLDLTRAGIACVQVGGKGNLPKWWRLFTAYDIPTYVIFDNDRRDDKKAEKRQDMLATLGVGEDEYANYLEAEDLVVEDRFAVFGGNYEATLRLSVPEYEALEEGARELLGSSKPLIARRVAELLDTESAGSVGPLARALGRFVGAFGFEDCISPVEPVNEPFYVDGEDPWATGNPFAEGFPDNDEEFGVNDYEDEPPF